MPDTGHFYVFSVDYATDARGCIDQVTAIAFRCNQCHHVSRADAELKRMTGGTLLTCGRCGSHQAVSNARLVDREHLAATGQSAAAADQR
jgi:RNA polymerase-binding transcription factor DksA